MHWLLSFGSLVAAEVRPVKCRNRGIARAELQGEAPAAFAAGITREPALAAEDAGDALRNGLAAPTARGHDGCAAEEIVLGLGDEMMIEATTTVALVRVIHGCTSTLLCGQRQDLRSCLLPMGL